MHACKYATISLLIIFQKILPLGQIWTDLSEGVGDFLLVIGQGQLAKGAGSESNSCEQLLSPNYIDKLCTLWDGNAICKIFHILFNKI
jgi:hypothetical protein